MAAVSMSEGAQKFPEQERLLRKLESIAELTEEERQAVLALPLAVRSFAADQDIVREHDRPHECCLVLEGFLHSFKSMADGRRQTLGYFIAGDVPDMQSLHLEVMDHSLSTLTPSRVAFIQHRDMLAMTQRYPGLAAACWRSTLIYAGLFREWMVNLGRRNARQRIAHLICEMNARSRAVFLNQGDSFEFPVTQQELGDATGLSTVHVNRVIQELRQERLITWERGTVTIINARGLAQAGEFDPLYLHQRGR